MKARLLPGARPPIALETGTWYAVAYYAVEALWLDAGGDLPVRVEKLYLETVEDREG